MSHLTWTLIEQKRSVLYSHFFDPLAAAADATVAVDFGGVGVKEPDVPADWVSYFLFKLVDNFSPNTMLSLPATGCSTISPLWTSRFFLIEFIFGFGWPLLLVAVSSTNWQYEVFTTNERVKNKQKNPLARLELTNMLRIIVRLVKLSLCWVFLRLYFRLLSHIQFSLELLCIFLSLSSSHETSCKLPKIINENRLIDGHVN